MPGLIALSQARESAAVLLARLSASNAKPLRFFSGEFGVPEYEEHHDAWVFNWNSADFLASGDTFDQVLVGPIVVPKDGSPPFPLGTAGTTQEELDRWRRRVARGGSPSSR